MQSKTISLKAKTAAWLAFWLLIFPPSGLAAPHPQFRGVSDKIIVKGDPKHVYEAIRTMRGTDKSIAKVVYQTENEQVVEESFDGIPVLGHATIRYKQLYTPYAKIEYVMLNSDKFLVFEGSCTLTPIDEGRQTLVEWSSYTDTGINAPFARQITNAATMKDIHTRLNQIKLAVETNVDLL